MQRSAEEPYCTLVEPVGWLSPHLALEQSFSPEIRDGKRARMREWSASNRKGSPLTKLMNGASLSQHSYNTIIECGGPIISLSAISSRPDTRSVKFSHPGCGEIDTAIETLCSTSILVDHLLSCEMN